MKPSKRQPQPRLPSATFDGGFVETAVRDALASNRVLADVCRTGRPGSWGRLAGLGIVRYRMLTGRSPNDRERRAVWALLWKRLREVPAADQRPWEAEES